MRLFGMYQLEKRPCGPFFKLTDHKQTNSSQGESWSDVELSAAVHFWTFLVRMDHSEIFSGESKNFYLVAFFSM